MSVDRMDPQVAQSQDGPSLILVFLSGIYFLFKGLYHLYKIGFKVIFLCFSCVRISRAFCSRIAVLDRCHIALDFVDCVLMLDFIHLVDSGSS